MMEHVLDNDKYISKYLLNFVDQMLLFTNNLMQMMENPKMINVQMIYVLMNLHGSFMLIKFEEKTLEHLTVLNWKNWMEGKMN